MHRWTRFKYATVALTVLAVVCGWRLSPLLPGSGRDLYEFRSARLAMLSITMKESLQHVGVLASDLFEGRGPGTAGGQRAAAYIAREFSEYGLKPAGEGNSYLQRFKIVSTDLEEASLKVSRRSSVGRQSTLYTLRDDFIPFDFTGEAEITAPVVFAGYGITAPEYGYDDYRQIDATGKIVLVLRHEPQENDESSVFAGSYLTRHALFFEKAENALAHGAAGMLLVTDPGNGHSNLEPQGFWPAFFPDREYPERWEQEMSDGFEDFPALWVDATVANDLLRSSGWDLDALRATIDSTLIPLSFELPSVRVHLDIDLKRKVRETANVLGLLPGGDTKLGQETMVVGAHYDHVGIKDGRIYYGADDNASGVAGLLEIAEAFAESPTQPRRSLLFIAFGAEELGLLGSRFYVRNPPIPLERTVAMINLDMIGRNAPDDVTVIGSNRSRELHEINERANHEIGLNLLYNGEKYFSRSDQANFARHKIPVLFYHTDSHPDYHQPTDAVQKINAEKIARISRLAFLVAWEVAHRDGRPSFGQFNPYVR